MISSLLRNSLKYFCVIGVMFPAATACKSEKGGRTDKNRPVPLVEAVDIETGPIDDTRQFSGTIEASASFTVAPKIGGRIERIAVDIGDEVARNAVVVRLDDDELKQAVTRAQADLLVAEANLAKAKSALQIAERTMARAQTLQDRGVASEADLDEVRTRLLDEKSQAAVYSAQVTRARAALKTAKIQVGYADVTASWQGEGDRRVTAERFVDEGQTVAADTPLLRIVALTPVTAVFFVTEKDYAFLRTGQIVSLITDAFPSERFEGTVARIAPVFENNSRQARVEVTVPNTDERLRPGMYITARVTVAQVPNATIVPADALAVREDVQGIFTVDRSGTTVRWRPVKVGVRSGQKVQIMDPGLTGRGFTGRVVTLGQQLLEDGSKIQLGSPRPSSKSEGSTP